METEETKAWWKSKTLIGLVISIGGKAGAMYFGVEITDADLTNATNATLQLVDASSINAGVSLLVGFAGDLYAWYGRVKAKKAISTKANS